MPMNTNMLGNAKLKRIRRGVLWCSICLLVVVLLAGCGDRDDDEPDAGVQRTSVATAETNSAATTPDATDSGRQLVVWLPDFASHEMDNGAGDLLSNAFSQWEQGNPGVRINVQTKADGGQSDMFSYLRAAQQVAPDILPDVALINTQNIGALVELGLLKPLDSSLSIRPDFYPFAMDAVQYGGQVYGTPYVADLLLLAGAGEDGAIPPDRWGELLSQDNPYYFAAAGGDLFENGAILIQYIGAGGVLLEDGSTSNPAALQDVFSFIQNGTLAGVMPESIAETASLDGVWNQMVDNEPAYGNLSADKLLAELEITPDIVYGPTPTRNGDVTSLASTWAFVILGEDESQRALAASLVDNLLNPTVQGPWSQYTQRLPTQSTALNEWAHQGALTDFLAGQLEVASAIPNGRAFADFANRMQTAQLGVLQGELTPEDAVETVRGPE